MPDTADPDLAQLARLAGRLVDELQLHVIRTLRVEAELLDWEAADSLQIQDAISQAEIQFARFAPTSVGFRFSHEEAFSDREGTEGARVAVDILAGFTCAENFEATSEEIEAFAKTSVVRLTYPFYRETVQSMLSRVGAKALTLGMITIPGSGEPAED